MKFKYIKIPIDPLKPWKSLPLIPVRVFGAKKNIYYDIYALLDSGADKSLANLELAKYLNLDLSNQPTEDFSGIDNIPIACKVINLEVQVIGDHSSIIIPVGFIENLPYALILGRDSFFDNYIITFNQSKEEIELKRI